MKTLWFWLKAFLLIGVVGLICVILLVPNDKQESKSRNNVDYEQPQEVGTGKARIKKLNEIIEAVATTRAIRSASISSLSSGRISKSYLNDDKLYEQDEILVQLDSLSEEADLIEAEARLELSKRSLERYKILKKSQALSEASIDDLALEVAISEAAYNRSKKALSDRSIRAPFSGYISFSDIVEGEYVNGGQELAIIDDLSNIRVDFSLPEYLIGRIYKNQIFQAETPAFYNRKFKGQITEINTRIDNESRSFKVRGLLMNAGDRLPSGMLLYLALILSERESVVVPEESVMVEGQSHYVFLLNETSDSNIFLVDKKYISIGKRESGLIEVISGIKINDEVITLGTQKVRAGSLVRKKVNADK